MAKVRAKDEILLAGGQKIPLGEALDQRLVSLKRSTTTTKKRGGVRTERPMYIAYQLYRGEEFFWEVGEMLYESRVRKTPEVLAPPIDSGSFDIAIDLDALRLISDWDAALAFLADAHFKARVKQFKYVLETAPSIKLAYDIVQENFDVDHPTILENLLETYGYD